MRVFWLLILLIASVSLNAQFKPVGAFDAASDTILMDYHVSEANGNYKAEKTAKSKNKFVAIGLTIALGPFGVHRLYLGTQNKVPLAYTLTLGGGFFILPIIDAFYILLSEQKYIENNPYFFIWNKKKELSK